jgi:hypothetical protein
MAAVSGLFIRAGHAVEPISPDYRNHLLVQPAHNGRMDPNRMWVQVKAMNSGSRRLRHRVPVEQIMRSLRSVDSTLLVLWDTGSDQGWFSYPDQVDLSVLGHQTATIHFDSENVLDLGAVGGIVWASRLGHYEYLCARAQIAAEQAGEDGSENEFTPSLVASDLLVLLDVETLLHSDASGQDFMYADGSPVEGSHPGLGLADRVADEFFSIFREMMRGNNADQLTPASDDEVVSAAALRTRLLDVAQRAAAEFLRRRLRRQTDVPWPPLLLRACARNLVVLSSTYMVMESLLSGGDT